MTWYKLKKSTVQSKPSQSPSIFEKISFHYRSPTPVTPKMSLENGFHAQISEYSHNIMTKTHDWGLSSKERSRCQIHIS